MTGDPRRRLITAHEAAAIVGVAPATIRDWVRKGELTPYATRGRRKEHLFVEAHVLIAERRIRKRRESQHHKEK